MSEAVTTPPGTAEANVYRPAEFQGGGAPPNHLPPAAAAAASPADQPPPTHFKNLLKLGTAIAPVCAISQGAGMIGGLADPGAGLLSLIVPTLCGCAFTVAVWASWEGVYKLASRAREPATYIGVAVTTLLLMGASAGCSSWAITSMIAGDIAIQRDQHNFANLQDDANDKAFAEVKKERAIIVIVHDAILKWDYLLRTEISGHFVGKAGTGTIANAIATTIQGYKETEGWMWEKFHAVEALNEESRELSAKQHEAIGHNSDVFDSLTQKRRAIIGEYNALEFGEHVVNGGIVNMEDVSGKNGAARVKAVSDQITSEMVAGIKKVQHDRHQVTNPDYERLSAREAVWRYAGTVAKGGWITALALDWTPAAWCLVLLSGALSRLLNRPAEAPKRSIDPDYPDKQNDGAA